MKTLHYAISYKKHSKFNNIESNTWIWPHSFQYTFRTNQFMPKCRMHSSGVLFTFTSNTTVLLLLLLLYLLREYTVFILHCRIFWKWKTHDVSSCNSFDGLDFFLVCSHKPNIWIDVNISMCINNSTNQASVCLVREQGQQPQSYSCIIVLYRWKSIDTTCWLLRNAVKNTNKQEKILSLTAFQTLDW